MGKESRKSGLRGADPAVSTVTPTYPPLNPAPCPMSPQSSSRLGVRLTPRPFCRGGLVVNPEPANRARRPGSLPLAFRAPGRESLTRRAVRVRESQPPPCAASSGPSVPPPPPNGSLPARHPRPHLPGRAGGRADRSHRAPRLEGPQTTGRGAEPQCPRAATQELPSAGPPKNRGPRRQLFDLTSGPAQ